MIARTNLNKPPGTWISLFGSRAEKTLSHCPLATWYTEGASLGHTPLSQCAVPTPIHRPWGRDSNFFYSTKFMLTLIHSYCLKNTYHNVYHMSFLRNGFCLVVFYMYAILLALHSGLTIGLCLRDTSSQIFLRWTILGTAHLGWDLVWETRKAISGYGQGVMEPACTSSWDLMMHIPSHLRIQWHLVGNLKPAIVGILFPLWKLENTTSHFFLPLEKNV